MFDSHEELYSGRPYGALDSGFNSVDSGDKRWSGNEVSVAALFLLSAVLYKNILICICLDVHSIGNIYAIVQVALIQNYLLSYWRQTTIILYGIDTKLEVVREMYKTVHDR